MYVYVTNFTKDPIDEKLLNDLKSEDIMAFAIINDDGEHAICRSVPMNTILEEWKITPESKAELTRDHNEIKSILRKRFEKRLY